MDLYEYGYGSVAIRLNVTGKEFPKNSLSIHLGKKSMILMAGEEARITHTISSFSSNDMTSVIFDIPIRFNLAYLGITVAHPCVSTPARVRWYLGLSTAVCQARVLLYARPEYCCMPGQSTAVCQA